jgi:hypothetical protein
MAASTKSPRYRIVLEPAINGRVRGKTHIQVFDGEGVLVLPEHADLRSIRDRERAAETLAEKLGDVTAEEILPGIEDAWTGMMAEHRRRQEEAQAAATAAAARADAPDEADPEAPGLRLLEETPQDIRGEAADLLRDPDLIDRITDDIELQGVAGETMLATTLYIVYTSRKLTRPSSARVRGPTTSGKSHVIDSVATLMPPEAVIRATQMTPQALYHMRPGSLRHRLILAGERSRDDRDAAADATRALREMISSGRLSKLMPMKVGQGLETVLIEQEGPVAFVESTTLAEVFAEDENRCLPLFTDERAEQTRRIITAVADGYTGRRPGGRDPERVRLIHHAAQRRLRRRGVIVPFAPALGKAMPEARVEVRRVFPLVVSMVQAVALLYQLQRPHTDDGRVIAGPKDYRLVRLLLEGAMRRLLGGGTSEAAGRFLERLRGWFGGVAFTIREAKARETTSQSGVYAWVHELHDAGLVEQVSCARGRAPATWRVAAGAAADQKGDLLPTMEQVFWTGTEG